MFSYMSYSISKITGFTVFAIDKSYHTAAIKCKGIVKDGDGLTGLLCHFFSIRSFLIFTKRERSLKGVMKESSSFYKKFNLKNVLHELRIWLDTQFKSSFAHCYHSNASI